MSFMMQYLYLTNQVRSLYVGASLLVVTIVTLSILTPEAAAQRGLPCNNYLSRPLSTATDPVVGSVIGLKEVFFGVGAAAVLIGIFLIIADVGKKILRYGLLVFAGLLLFGAIVGFGDNVGLADSC